MEDMALWFVTGTQELYGEESFRNVRKNATRIAEALNASEHIPTKVVFTGALTSRSQIATAIAEANNTPTCIGIIAWMHTFSPAKMWIRGLTELHTPPSTASYSVESGYSLV
jgi:L-arabinose isomerase